eukprot:IDg1630t1
MSCGCSRVGALRLLTPSALREKLEASLIVFVWGGTEVLSPLLSSQVFPPPLVSSTAVVFVTVLPTCPGSDLISFPGVVVAGIAPSRLREKNALGIPPRGESKAFLRQDVTLSPSARKTEGDSVCAFLMTLPTLPLGAW